MSELFNATAEQTFLAGVLSHPDAYAAINPIGLGANDFIGQEDRKVMAAIEAVQAENKEPETALVLEELDNASPVSETYISKLLALACSVPAAFEAGKIVKGLATARRLVAAGQAIIETARENRADSPTAMAMAESKLRDVRDTLPMDPRSPEPADILRRLRQMGPESGIPIRFAPSLHDLSGGLIPGHLWTIGGFSSVGKSAVAANFVRDAADSRAMVALFSTEMTSENYMQRLLALWSGIPFRTIRDRSYIGLEQIDAIREAEQYLARAPIRVYDTVFRLSEIRTQASILKQKHDLKVVIVDFLQNVRAATGDFSFQDLTEITLDLQQLAKDLKVTVICLSQLSNEMAKYQNEGQDLNFYSFKGSGAIRDASDFALMLKRDRIRGSSDLEIAVLKNRHGQLKNIFCEMDLPTGRIQETLVDY